MPATTHPYTDDKGAYFPSNRKDECMSEKPSDDERHHNEAPAEGDLDADPEDIRVHTEDPAEGADPADPDGSGN
jgi:hypothetical protein